MKTVSITLNHEAWIDEREAKRIAIDVVRQSCRVQSGWFIKDGFVYNQEEVGAGCHVFTTEDKLHKATLLEKQALAVIDAIRSHTD